MGGLLLGIDVGTTYCKAVVLDAEGEELAQARVRTPWTRVPTGAEIDPDALAATALSAAAQAVASAPAGTVAAVGVAGMGETGVLLDRSGRPVGPAIAWHDARGEREGAARRRERLAHPPHRRPASHRLRHEVLPDAEPGKRIAPPAALPQLEQAGARGQRQLGHLRRPE